MAITDADILSVARLARLGLSDHELAAQHRHIAVLLERFGALQALDLGEVEPTLHAIPIRNVLRDDVVGQSLTQADALANAPDAREGCFVVPRILKD